MNILPQFGITECLIQYKPKSVDLEERINPLLAEANTAAPIQSPKIASYPNLQSEEENLPIAAEPETTYHKPKNYKPKG